MNVNNSTQNNETFTWPPIPVPTLITLYSILFVWTLLGNVLVIAVVYWNQNLRTNMNYLIVNMAVSDLLIPFVAMPFLISWFFLRPWEWLVDGPLGAALCKLVPFLCLISPSVSSISLVIIAFQRFIVVVYPTRRQMLSSKTRWIAISFPWIVSMALFSPLFYTYRVRKSRRGYTMCYYSWSPAFDFLTAETIFLCIQAVVGFVIPLVIIIILYTIMVYKLRESLNNVMDLIEKQTIRSRQRRNRRIIRMLMTIVVMFTICWCPYNVFRLLRLLYIQPLHSFSSTDFDTLMQMFFSLGYIWHFLAAINPCIYFVFLRDFRQGLKSLCCSKTPSTNEAVDRRAIARIPVEDEDGDQDPTCTSPHINTTSV